MPFRGVGPVKRATCTDFVAKSRTTLYVSPKTFRNLLQPNLLQGTLEEGKHWFISPIIFFRNKIPASLLRGRY